MKQKITKFNYSSESFFGGQIDLNLVGNIVTVSTRNFERKELTVSHTPTVDEWLEFKSSLDIHKVWQWSQTYNEKHVLDGTSWSLIIHSHESKLATGGYGKHPPDFDIFLKSINRLVLDDIF